MVENSQCLQGLFWTLLTLFEFLTLLLVSCFALQFWPQHRPLAPPWQPGDHSHLPCLPLCSCSWQFLTMNSSVSCVGLLLDDSCQMWPRSLSKCCNESERFLTFSNLSFIFHISCHKRRLYQDTSRELNPTLKHDLWKMGGDVCIYKQLWSFLGTCFCTLCICTSAVATIHISISNFGVRARVEHVCSWCILIHVKVSHWNVGKTDNIKQCPRRLKRKCHVLKMQGLKRASTVYRKPLFENSFPV